MDAVSVKYGVADFEAKVQKVMGKKKMILIEACYPDFK